MATKKPPIVVIHAPADRDPWRFFAAFFFSFLFNGMILSVFFLTDTFRAEGGAREEPEPEYFVAQIEEELPAPNLEVTDLGEDPSQQRASEVGPLGPETIPGFVVDAPPGMRGEPEAAPSSIPPPSGVPMPGKDGARLEQMDTFAHHGPMLPGHGLNQRLSSSTRAHLLEKRGGNLFSEAAVARGLKFLADHQATDGHWSFAHFHQHGRCNCTGQAKYDNVAATSFGILPFLGAGQTHRGGSASGNAYTKQVDAGLKWLLRQQNRDGEFHPNMYSHALATMTICEAYALTSDPLLRRPAQRALDYIVAAQSAEGGWRYQRKQAGYDTSVGGWQVMALKSGQMAGLRVPAETLNRAKKWLDAAGTPDGSAYGYTTPGQGATTSAVGLLCREYFGWGPRHPGLQGGIKRLASQGPNPKNMYFSYYATQVMHHAGGTAWEDWNPGMRDGLIQAQDQGTDPAHPHQKGSWHHPGSHAGRLMDTSLSILTLEVYYRHLPLYRRDIGGDKEVMEQR